MRIVVAGALANKPFNGGAAWTRLSWVFGFRDWYVDHLELALHAQNLGSIDLDVIVVDDGSDDPGPVRAAVEAAGGRVIRVDGRRPWSAAAVFDVGIRSAVGEYIVTTDADMLFGPRTIEIMRATASNAPNGYGAYALVQYRDLPEDLPTSALRDLPWEVMAARSTLDARWAMGCTCYRKSFIEHVRGYDERLVWWGVQDNDLSRRAERYGLPIQWVEEPDARIFHLWHPRAPVVNRGNPDFQRTLAKNRHRARLVSPCTGTSSHGEGSRRPRRRCQWSSSPVSRWRRATRFTAR